jgi:CheY-like chemotaxis protein
MSDTGLTVRTILLIEDNEITREGLAAILKRAGLAVDAVSNGQEALDYLARAPRPDLIVLDMLMPVLDGWHFLESLRRLVPPQTTPVLIATGTILTREWARDHGCAGLLRKPIETEALLAEVRRCLGTAG